MGMERLQQRECCQQLTVPPLLVPVTLQNKIVPNANGGRHLHELHCMMMHTNGHERISLYPAPTI